MMHKYGLVNHTEMNIRYVGFEGIIWIQLTQNIFLCRAFVDTALDVGPRKHGGVCLPAKELSALQENCAKWSRL